MPTYEFRCARCGSFDAVFSMQEVPDTAACACGGPAPRAMTAPRLGRSGAGAMRLLDATKATADRPAVVTSVPGRSAHGTGRAPAPPDPRQARLPRP